MLEKDFSYSDDCGLLIIDKLNNYAESNAELTCGTDSCLLHLQTLKSHSKISNLDDWKTQTFYHSGRKFGGQTCNLLWNYGLSILAPIFLNTIFNILIFVEDTRLGKASYVEFIFVVVQFYPQWRTICFLREYIRHRDENKLNEAKDKFDVEVGALEPFLESAFQVSHQLLMISVKLSNSLSMVLKNSLKDMVIFFKYSNL